MTVDIVAADGAKAGEPFACTMDPIVDSPEGLLPFATLQSCDMKQIGK